LLHGPRRDDRHRDFAYRPESKSDCDSVFCICHQFANPRWRRSVERDIQRESVSFTAGSVRRNAIVPAAWLSTLSLDEQIIHAVPSKRRVAKGDLIKIQTGGLGRETIRSGARVGDIGAAIQSTGEEVGSAASSGRCSIPSDIRETMYAAWPAS
jgi:hypothetical protein